jgi:hypothetical protein
METKSVSRIKIPDNFSFSKSLETVLGLKILEYYDADPGFRIFLTGMEKLGSWILDKHPGSATLLAANLSPAFFFHLMNLMSALSR